MFHLLLLLVPAAAQVVVPTGGVSKLKFLGDFQAGEWDTDAAEHVAYDAATQRTFIASAASAVVQVVDILNPTKPEQVGSMPVPKFSFHFQFPISATSFFIF